MKRDLHTKCLNILNQASELLTKMYFALTLKNIPSWQQQRNKSINDYFNMVEIWQSVKDNWI